MKTDHWINGLLQVASSALLSATCWISTARGTEAAPPMSPPVAPVRVVSEHYFGVTVSDPYRYMEDTSLPEVAGWFKDQNTYTHTVLATIPGRANLLSRIKQLDGSAGEAGSAGGILIGRAFTERPNLFAAVLDDVGLSDMIRDMFSPDGPLNVPEYGDLKVEQGFKNLLEISAYYHVNNGVKYPAIMLTAGMNDPRVVPWEPAKMAARLQAATASGKPVLLRVEYQGGHGTIGGTKEQVQNLLADQWSFLLWQFGIPGYQPATPTRH